MRCIVQINARFIIQYIWNYSVFILYYLEEKGKEKRGRTGRDEKNEDSLRFATRVVLCTTGTWLHREFVVLFFVLFCFVLYCFFFCFFAF